MKKLIITLTVILMPFALFSQIEFKIKELNVSQINVKFSESEFIEGEKEGPYIDLVCAIRNVSEASFDLYPSKSEFFLVFHYKGEKYTQRISSLSFADNDTLTLKNSQTVEVNLGSRLLLGTPILKKDDGDYTKEMLRILPTIKVIFKEKTNLKVVSDEIINVEIR